MNMEKNFIGKNPDGDATTICSMCSKHFASKFSLKRHMETQHFKRQKQDSQNEEENQSDEDGSDNDEDDEDDTSDNSKTEDEDENGDSIDDAVDAAKTEKPPNYIWRKLIKRVLKKGQQNGSIEIPETEDELLEMKEKIRDGIFHETLKIWNDYHDLIQSPIYKKISRSEKHYRDQVSGDSDDDSDIDTETFEYAFDIRKRLLNQFISDNADIVHEFVDMSTEETGL